MYNFNDYVKGNRDVKREFAHTHTEIMGKEYKDEIQKSAQGSKIYSYDHFFNFGNFHKNLTVKIEPVGTTDAIFEYAGEGKMAALNFASYKNPGGGFYDGAKAQEEWLCAESDLYNVLNKFPQYYDWNKSNLNRALYLNRAIYTPNILFIRNNNKVECNMINCAAPNLSPAKKGGWLMDIIEDNKATLRSRIDFILGIAAEQQIETLILGAFGCGVFSQNPTEVATDFMELLTTKYKGCFSNVIFAIPLGRDNNYNAFYKVIEDFSKNKK